MQSYENVYVYVRKESNSHRISLLQFYCPRTAHLRPPWLVCAPNQNRHATQAMTPSCCVYTQAFTKVNIN